MYRFIDAHFCKKEYLVIVHKMNGQISSQGLKDWKILEIQRISMFIVTIFMRKYIDFFVEVS